MARKKPLQSTEEQPKILEEGALMENYQNIEETVTENVTSTSSPQQETDETESFLDEFMKADSTEEDVSTYEIDEAQPSEQPVELTTDELIEDETATEDEISAVEEPSKDETSTEEESPVENITPITSNKEVKKTQNKPAPQSFFSIDFKELDRDLSEEQRAEWNAIYASYRSKSILSGTVAGIDEHTFDMSDENGETVRRRVRSLVIINYRVKVLIPESEIWMDNDDKPGFVARSMIGATVDYVIMNVDRVGECAVASRRMAIHKRKRGFIPRVNELVKAYVLVVGAKKMLMHYGGFDLILTQRDLSYTAIADLRELYKPGQELTARLLRIEDNAPVISVKEVNPNPFEGADCRHPVGSRRQAIIQGKYAGGVFCSLPDGVTCLCLYSNAHEDSDFPAGIQVLIYITRYDYERKLVYGRIISKW